MLPGFLILKDYNWCAGFVRKTLFDVHEYGTFNVYGLMNGGFLMVLLIFIFDYGNKTLSSLFLSTLAFLSYLSFFPVFIIMQVFSLS